MPNLKPVIRKHIDKDGKSNIKIAVIHDHKIRYIKTPWYIAPQYIKNGLILSSYPAHTSLNLALSRLLTEYNTIINEIGYEVMLMDINTLVSKLKLGHGVDFVKYTEAIIKNMKDQTAGTFGSMLSNLITFAGKKTIIFKEINTDFLTRLENWMILKDLKTSTIGKYMNCICKVFNHAIKTDIIKADLYPFRKYKIKRGVSLKRALEIEDLRKILNSKVKNTRQAAQDCFRLIFFLCGISIKDLLMLRPEALKGGRIEYQRFKTGGQYSIKVIPQTMELIEKYRGEKYLLKLMDENKNYCSVARNINYHLNKIHPGLTTYHARHSWATVARKIGISKDDIQLALGHSLKSITDGYIDYDMMLERIDRANEQVIKAVCL